MTDPPTPVLGIRWRTGRCFKTRVPKTVVLGEIHDHVALDKDLPQPLKQGFIEWAHNLRNRRPVNAPGGRPIPPGEAESRYLHRTLRFWKLSTDYSRFMVITNHSPMPTDGVAHDTDDQEEDDDEIYEVVRGGFLVRVPARLPGQQNAEQQNDILYWSSIQRPYTAPPHQFAPSFTATTTTVTRRRT